MKSSYAGNDSFSQSRELKISGKLISDFPSSDPNFPGAETVNYTWITYASRGIRPVAQTLEVLKGC